MTNPVNATTDPDSGLRSYKWGDQDLISVTSIRRVIGVPFGLAIWQVNQAIAAAVDSHGAAWAEAMPDDEYAKALRKAATLKRDEAAALGTAVHEAADIGLKSGGMPDIDPRKPFLHRYEEWVAAMKPTILVSEGQVFNLREGYAGSLDLIARIDNKAWLIDLKTGSGVYNDHALQLALYYGGDFIGGYDPVEDKDVIDPVATRHLEAVTGIAILHLRPEAWDFIPIDLTDELLGAASNMVDLCRFFRNHPTIESLKGTI